MPRYSLRNRVILRHGMLLACICCWVCGANRSFAQSVPATLPAVPPAAPPAVGFAGKCASCVGSLGGMLSGCKQRCCNSPLGTLINGAFKPLNFATGGVIPTPCPGPNQPSNKPGGGAAGGGAGGPPGPQQAAEAIKQDQAQAKARAEAVRYLATVPCHYYPEAEVALITALRTDRSDCVRWEAAHALAQGCCCTKRTVEALKIAASGSQKDGNPGEVSVRVRVEAINALQHCLCICSDTLESPQRPESPAPEPETIPTPPAPRRPEVPTAYQVPAPDAVIAQTVDYYDAVEQRPTQELLAEAKQLVDAWHPALQPSTDTRRHGRSLLELWQRSEVAATTNVPTGPRAIAPPVAENPPQVEASDQPQPAPAPLPPGWGESISRLPTTSVLKSKVSPDLNPTADQQVTVGTSSHEPAGMPHTLGRPQFAVDPHSTYPIDARHVPGSAGLPAPTTDPIVDQLPNGSLDSRTLEPSQQWIYPPYEGSIRAALRRTGWMTDYQAAIIPYGVDRHAVRLDLFGFRQPRGQ